jgi:hypothetical protein
MCNDDARHVVEIVAILSGVAVFYQEARYHRAEIHSDNFMIRNLTTPLGWGVSVILFWVLAFPAYFYIKKSRATSTTVSEASLFFKRDWTLFIKTIFFLIFAFFFTYKQ